MPPSFLVVNLIHCDLYFESFQIGTPGHIVCQRIFCAETKKTKADLVESNMNLRQSNSYRITNEIKNMSILPKEAKAHTQVGTLADEPILQNHCERGVLEGGNI